MDNSLDYIKTFIGIFAIVNPLGAVPLFIGMTEGQDAKLRRAIARTATLTSTVVLIGAVFIGQALLNFFGVSIGSFRIAGGILLLLTAISMLHGQRSRTKVTPGEEEEAASKESIAIVPLAIPLLAGPGAISTAILYGYQAVGLADNLYVVAACAATGALTYVSLMLAEPIGRALGKTGINIFTRLFGILLAALGVEFIIGGLMQMMPALAR
ncbi:MAG: NAAT family transporter [Myxococcales bacterium]|nr:MAG: NAAT family transporter [Myxococcales bacterium]